MEKLERRIIEIRENINFLDEKMNQMYSAYEIAKDKKEDAEVNLEILNSQKKDISTKIHNKQISKVSIVLVPLNLVFFEYLVFTDIHFGKTLLLSNTLLIISMFFIGILCGYILSFIFVKILNSLISTDWIMLFDKDIKVLRKEERLLNKKIKNTSKLLKEYRSNEKEYAEKYSSLCTKYNSSKELLDEVESLYFDKTKLYINDLKTYSLYSLLTSLSEDDREYIVNSIKNNFLNYTK